MKYIFEEMRDKAGVGSQKEFETKEEALAYAQKKWNHLNDYDKNSYINDKAGMFRVYKVDDNNEWLEDVWEAF